MSLSMYIYLSCSKWCAFRCDSHTDIEHSNQEKTLWMKQHHSGIFIHERKVTKSRHEGIILKKKNTHKKLSNLSFLLSESTSGATLFL